MPRDGAGAEQEEREKRTEEEVQHRGDTNRVRRRGKPLSGRPAPDRFGDGAEALAAKQDP